MRFNPVPLIAVWLLWADVSYAQITRQKQDEQYRITLKSNSFIPPRNIDENLLKSGKISFRPNGKAFLIIQFDKIPSANERARLKSEGIELVDYIPNNAYTAVITGIPKTEVLQRSGARALVNLLPSQKMEPALARGNFPAWAVKVNGTIDVWISFPSTFSYESVMKGLAEKNININSSVLKDYRIVELRVATSRLEELALLPFVEYIQSVPKDPEPFNDRSVAQTKANVLQSNLPGERNLQGDGVVVGIGDYINPWQHIDITGRFINRSPATGTTINDRHGIHVAGTIAGAGIVREQFRGYAPRAQIIAQFTRNILDYAPVYVQDYGMVITNNSYSMTSSQCEDMGVYDLYSRMMDLQTFQMPHLQHVFAAGNSGSQVCTPYAVGFGNVFGGPQSAKNLLTVGSTSDFLNSSKGPVKDGRIKPEIVARGALNSTVPTNTYGSEQGTSMSAPGVAGGLALMYQRYRQLHAGANPKSGLMKALLCNGATDIGNAGVDFTYGFGVMNLLRSVTMLEKGNYINTTVNNAATNSHSITIPAGSSLAQLKVMLYWNDSAAAPLAAHALVNDLDLEVSDPSSRIYYPQLLDTTPVNVNTDTISGPDHVNNIEQVVINNPTPGTYTFSVKGTTIPSGTQHEYFLVYDTVPVSVKLTFPMGGERLVTGSTIILQWDAFGNPANNFTLQYSPDDGASWSAIGTGPVAANLRQLSWALPTAATNQARIKLIHNGTGIESVSERFTILGVPTLTLAGAGNQCEGYIVVNWTAVTGATDYEVMQLNGQEMTPVATTTATTYTFKGLSKDTVYWVTVRPRINGVPGRRANAVSRQPNTGSCPGNISNGDLKIDTILGPSTGRLYTSTALTNNTVISIRIENLDNAVTAGNIPVSYTINNNPPVNEVIVAPIPSRQSIIYHFTTPADLSALGSYTLKVKVSSPGDPVANNDSLVKTIRQLDNPFVDLTVQDYFEDFESVPEQTFTREQTGLTGLDRYDFSGSTLFARIRSFVNSGIAFSGTKALTLDADRYNAAGTADTLNATFNLGGYSVDDDLLRLDFMYKHHNQEPNPVNKVWIRGSDLDPWIEVYDLFDNQEDPGDYKRVSGLDLSETLKQAGQLFSPSFQVRWGQWGRMVTADNELASGYTFDDIRLYKVANDLHLVSIDTPVIASCGLDNAVPVTVTVRNTVNNDITSIPVKYQVDNGAVITETIAFIGAKGSLQYTFTAAADLSATGLHTVKAWVDLPADSYRGNDTAIARPYNSPVVSSFPHLQNFETDEGGWHAEGKRSSWQYGTPSSARINGAASGSKAWKTQLAGDYNDRERSYLYSPCYDVSGLSKPMLSLSIALDLEDCGTTRCDAAYMEYSADGKTWARLGTAGAGTNWYNKNYSGNHVWSIEDYTHWHVATIPLPSGLDRLRLRVVVETDPFVSKEGIAIDDIHIYDSVYSIYDGPATTSPVVTQAAVNGSNWVDFVSAGKIVASIKPNGQDLGSTDVQAYIHTGPVRINYLQYYHNRNITIKPANINLADTALVRFYFLDTETEALRNATGCATCSKPRSAYELGVTKYSNVDDALENGTLSDNTGGNYLFTIPSNVVKVPFDKGYYAEFKVKDFSEFWLNNGGPANDQALPVELISFTAQKTADGDVLTSWTTASENNSDKFEVELARGNDEYRQNRFVKIGEVNSHGNSSIEQHYKFSDAEYNKHGVRYYRLKIMDLDGRYTYSPVRSVVFDDEIKWQVYPNPSNGIFNLACQADVGEKIVIRVYDVNGKLVHDNQAIANGFVQKVAIDLGGTSFAPGMYFMEVRANGKKWTFRLLRK